MELPSVPLPTWVYFTLFFLTNVVELSNRYVGGPLTNQLMASTEMGGLGATESQIGSLLLAFYIPSVFMGMVAGFLGDRWSRKTIMCISLVGEFGAMFLSTYAQNFTQFLIARGAVGFFGASFITIAPTVVADMYTGETRTMLLTVFSIGGPIGVAVCFGAYGVLGPAVGWRYSLQIFSFVTLGTAFAMGFVIPEYERGQADRAVEDGDDSERSKMKIQETEGKPDANLIDTVKYLVCVKTFMISCVAFAFVSCVTESGMSWFVEFLRRLFITYGDETPCRRDFLLTEAGGPNTTVGGGTLCTTVCPGACYDAKNMTEVQCSNCDSSAISSIFGMISLLCGIIGTLVGGVLSTIGMSKFRIRSSGPLVCTAGCALGTAGILVLMYVDVGTVGAWALCSLIFVGISSVFGILADIIPRVVLPDKRSMANSVQNAMGRLIGGTIPPYLTGFLAEQAAKSQTKLLLEQDNVTDEQYFSLQLEALRTGFLAIPVYALLGTISWLACVKYFRADEDKCKKQQGLSART